MKTETNLDVAQLSDIEIDAVSGGRYGNNGQVPIGGYLLR